MIASSFTVSAAPVSLDITRFGTRPDSDTLSTAAIQSAIDACAKEGGGIVRVPRGVFKTGALFLKTGVTLDLAEGAILRGSANHLDYGEGNWRDAIISGIGVENCGISGTGLIDGADARNPKGEEGFRGPHGVVFTKSRNIAVSGVTIERTGNYAILCTDTSGGKIDKVTIRGGHDGLHAQACSDFVVTGCDFRTGDDAFAGCDNRNFRISDCLINSSCNAFRFGCDGLIVERCRLWGPGEHLHQVSKRNNMLAAFVHFAPEDRNPKFPSDNWLIKDLQVDNATTLYEYDFERGLWQTGQPAKRIRFENIKATRLHRPISVVGDAERQLDLSFENVSLSLLEGREEQANIEARRFGSIHLNRVTLQNNGKVPVLRATDGATLSLREVTILPADHAKPVVLHNVDAIENGGPRLALGEPGSARAMVPLARKTALAWPNDANRAPKFYAFGSDEDYVSLEKAARADKGDLDASFAALWNSKTLRFLIRVTDNKHSAPPSGKANWTADSAQIAIQLYRQGERAPQGASEYSFAQGAKGTQAYRVSSQRGLPEGNVDSKWCRITQEGNALIYDISLSASELGLTGLEEGMVVGCSLLVNDNDGNGRKGYLQWGGGIGGEKNPALYHWLILAGK